MERKFQIGKLEYKTDGLVFKVVSVDYDFMKVPPKKYQMGVETQIVMVVQLKGVDRTDSLSILYINQSDQYLVNRKLYEIADQQQFIKG